MAHTLHDVQYKHQYNEKYNKGDLETSKDVFHLAVILVQSQSLKCQRGNRHVAKPTRTGIKLIVMARIRKAEIQTALSISRTASQASRVFPSS